PELLVVALGLVDVAHPAASDQSRHSIRPDAISGQIIFGFGCERQSGVRDRIADEVFCGVSFEQGENFAPQIIIGAAGARQVGVALARREINRYAKNLFNALPAFRIHGHQVPFPRRSHARASRVSWPIVAIETPSSAAVSSRLKPPK